MKRLFYLASSVVLSGLMLASCNFSNIDLDGTSWEIMRSEDLLNGRVVNSYLDDSGYVEFIGDRNDFMLTIDSGNGKGPETFTSEDITIVRAGAGELVFDMYYYEYDDVTLDDVEPYTTYKGVKIYRGSYLYNGNFENYYCYFKSNGVAVDVGCYNYEGEPDIWWDSCRYYCRRSR